MNINKSSNFIDIASLDTNQKFYWDKRAIESLRQSFDYVKESRERLKHKNPNQPLEKELEETFQVAGSLIMQLAKMIKANTEPKKEILTK